MSTAIFETTLVSSKVSKGPLSRAKQRMGEDPLTVKRGGAGERVKAEYRWYAYALG